MNSLSSQTESDCVRVHVCVCACACTWVAVIRQRIPWHFFSPSPTTPPRCHQLIEFLWRAFCGEQSDFQPPLGSLSVVLRGSVGKRPHVVHIQNTCTQVRTYTHIHTRALNLRELYEDHWHQTQAVKTVKICFSKLKKKQHGSLFESQHEELPYLVWINSPGGFV